MSSRCVLLPACASRTFYGTAWKRPDAAAGRLWKRLRGIDTANQRKHYHEGVGQAIAQPFGGAETRRPIRTDKVHFPKRARPSAAVRSTPSYCHQVEQSFASSLTHLRVETIDSYLLLSRLSERPRRRRLVRLSHGSDSRQQQSQLLGVSNVNLEQLEELYRGARSNRPSPEPLLRLRGWDRAVRKFFSDNKVVYQLRPHRQRDALAHPGAPHARSEPHPDCLPLAASVGMLPHRNQQRGPHAGRLEAGLGSGGNRENRGWSRPLAAKRNIPLRACHNANSSPAGGGPGTCPASATVVQKRFHRRVFSGARGNPACSARCFCGPPAASRLAPSPGI